LPLCDACFPARSDRRVALAAERAGSMSLGNDCHGASDAMAPAAAVAWRRGATYANPPGSTLLTTIVTAWQERAANGRQGNSDAVDAAQLSTLPLAGGPRRDRRRGQRWPRRGSDAAVPAAAVARRRGAGQPRRETPLRPGAAVRRVAQAAEHSGIEAATYGIGQ
jgi:hypothetical protein